VASFSWNTVRGLLGDPNLKNLPVGQERNIFKTVQTADGKVFDRRPSHCALVLRMTTPTSDKNSGFEDVKMAELRSQIYYITEIKYIWRSIEFLTRGRISMGHAYPLSRESANGP
jgi:hypothetical protein